jgi:hypothetical protein
MGCKVHVWQRENSPFVSQLLLHNLASWFQAEALVLNVIHQALHLLALLMQISSEVPL